MNGTPSFLTLLLWFFVIREKREIHSFWYHLILFYIVAQNARAGFCDFIKKGAATDTL